jgi:hypothetical protein
MALSRKQALKQLRGLWPRIQVHLDYLAASPSEREVSHWRGEISNWLREMEEYLPHVGKKTAAEWQARIDACRATLGT